MFWCLTADPQLNLNLYTKYNNNKCEVISVIDIRGWTGRTFTLNTMSDSITFKELIEYASLSTGIP